VNSMCIKYWWRSSCRKN